LKFIASGIITVEMVQISKGKVPMLPKKINQATGKASNHLMGFNEVTWGTYCQSYMKSTKNLSDKQFDKIIKIAMEYVMTGNCTVNDTDIIEIEDNKDAHANIVDHECGVESDCRSF